MAIYQKTTPKLYFDLPFRCDSMLECNIPFRQNGVVKFTKRIDSMSWTEDAPCRLYLKLSAQETALLEVNPYDPDASIVEAQLHIKFTKRPGESSSDIQASKPIRIPVMECFDIEVI